mmetsp:Transcript_7630/g.11667  ORF Transcript_7630/g.11667 Transcript_7630/m.11667 type:complete len:346 (-) Transcript_7630:26-1063(-)
MDRDLFSDEVFISHGTGNQNNAIALNSQMTSGQVRRRLDTEETFKIGNMQQSNESFNNLASDSGSQILECEVAMLNDGLEALSITNDDDTCVSALTADDEYSAIPYQTSALSLLEENDKKLPPTEVSFKSSKLDELVANLAMQNTSTSTHANNRHLSCTFEMQRPVLARNLSCPSAAEFSAASTNFSSRTDSIPEHSIMVNGISINGIRSRNGDVFGECFKSNRSLLIGDRKRRVHRRCHSGAEISVGSLVGQSTILTELSSGASYTDSEASSVRALKSASAANDLLLSITGADEGIGCCQARQDKGIVKKELKHVVGMVTAPIRLLPIFKEKKADLQRSKGNLV